MVAARKNILVVDDDQDIIDSITLILESAGYRVRAAANAKQCFEALKVERPDLIVLDVMMETRIEGLKVACRLKADPRYRLVPVFLMSSGSEYRDWKTEKEDLGVDEFLEKPIVPEEVLIQVARFASTG